MHGSINDGECATVARRGAEGPPPKAMPAIRLERLRALREKHGFTAPVGDRVQASTISSQILARPDGFEAVLDDGTMLVIQQLKSGDTFRGKRLNTDKGVLLDEDGNFVPKNAAFLDAARERLRAIRFDWQGGYFKNRLGREVAGVKYTNWPYSRGHALTTVELLTTPLVEIDGIREMSAIATVLDRVGQPANFDEVRQRMEGTGVGYKAMTGVSWLPGLEPFKLPRAVFAEAEALGTAVFLLYDAVRALFGRDELLTRLLVHKMPERIPRIMDEAPMELVRPDLGIFEGPDKRLHLVATELESAPAGEGMSHAMEYGYGLPTTMADEFVRYLDGRPYVVLFTAPWAEYMWDQALFVAELRRRGVDATILVNRPLDEVHAGIQTSADWANPPDEAPDWVKAEWQAGKDWLGRLARLGFREFVRGVHPEDLPDTVGKAAVKRFGYFDNLGPATVERMERWRRAGATIVNGLSPFYETKVLMAAAQLPGVRDWIRTRNELALVVLDVHLAETRLLDPAYIRISALKGEDPREEECRQLWLTKFAAWDGMEQSWGARSVEFGVKHTQASWTAQIEERMKLGWPVVAQHFIAMTEVHTGFVDHEGKVRVLMGARPRFTPFLLRGKDGRAVCTGGTMTLRRDLKIHGATNAVEMPVVFED